MEIGGLIIAVIACVIIFYALPARIAKRHAVVTSREGDRFAQGVTLVGPVDSSDGHGETEVGSKLMSARSTQPLFPASNRAHPAVSPAPTTLLPDSHHAEGAFMTAVPNAKTDRVSTSQDTASLHRNHAQQMAALRSRRVARLAREKAAVQRRIVTAATATAFILLLTALAAFGMIGWGWLAIPSLFLVGTVAGSVYGASKAQSQNQAEIDDLEQIRSNPMTQNEGMGVRPSPKFKPKAGATEVKPVAKVNEVFSDAVEVISSGEGEVGAEVVRESGVEEPAKVEDSDPILVPAATATRQEKVSAQPWSVAKLPAGRYTSDSAVLGRRVHADTDLVPVFTHRSEGVPGRPLTTSPRKSDEVAATADLTGPTFRFDLDEVLEQRRAQ